MAFHPFDVSAAHVVYASLGGFVVLFGMFSLFIREKLYIGEAIWAFLFGVVIGPYGGDIFNPRGWASGNEQVSDDITLEVTRVVLAIGVFAIGVELPKQYMKRHWKSLFFLLAPIMTWGWFISAGIIFALVPALSFLSSLAVAACLTPTDPILAAAVVGGKYADKHVPAHLRHLLAAESGCNDGAAFPFLFIALYLIIDSTDGHAVEDWFLVTWLYEVTLGVVFGSLIGIGFRHLMKFCERKDLIDRQSYVAQYVSLAIFTIGATTLLGSDDLLAAFACGTAFAWDGFFNKQTEQSVFSSVIDLLFNVAAFVYIGAWMPFNEFSSVELTLSVWRLIVIAILVLLLRRLPIILLLYRWIPDIKTFGEAVFSGHFGPMGVGAVFISTLAKTRLPAPQSPPQDQVELLAASIQPVVAFMVLCSIVTHGLSIPSFSLGRRVHSVSRTWSRHPSVDPTPEWAHQTRMAHRPEDIVINRDADTMERGEATAEKHRVSELRQTSHASEKEASQSRAGHSLANAIQEELDIADQDISPAELNDEARPDNIPDGNADSGKTTEWKEGPDLVVEHHEQGGQIRVDVVPGAFAKKSHDRLVSFNLRAGETVEGLKKDAREAGKDLRSKLHEVGMLVNTAEPEQAAPGDANPETDGEDMSDEGWSDINDLPSPQQNGAPDTRVEATSSSPPTKQQRRNSIRRSIFKKPPQRRRSPDDEITEDPEILKRGRRMSNPSENQIGASHTSASTPAGSRKMRRDASPAPSVHWDDLKRPSRPSTPTDI